MSLSVHSPTITVHSSALLRFQPTHLIVLTDPFEAKCWRPISSFPHSTEPFGGVSSVSAEEWGPRTATICALQPLNLWRSIAPSFIVLTKPNKKKVSSLASVHRSYDSKPKAITAGHSHRSERHCSPVKTKARGVRESRAPTFSAQLTKWKTWQPFSRAGSQPSSVISYH